MSVLPFREAVLPDGGERVEWLGEEVGFGGRRRALGERYVGVVMEC